MSKKAKKNNPDRHNEKIKIDQIAADEIRTVGSEETEVKDGEDRESSSVKPVIEKKIKPKIAKSDNSGRESTETEKTGNDDPEKEKAKKETEPTNPENKESKKSDSTEEDDLYKDEVYKDLDTSDEGMIFLDISGNEVKEALSPEEEAEKNRKKITVNIDTEAALAWLLTVLCSAVFISLTFNNNVWLDEAFTASLVNTDMAGVLQRSMADTLPPLYNIILKLTTDIFGYTVPVMKLTSVLPMILTMILGATVVRKRFGALTSYIFIIAITMMPNMMFYGVEIRMYSLGFLFATASGIFVYEVIREPSKKNWVLFTLSSVLAGYSHHFAFVTVGFIYLFLLIYTVSEQKKFNTERDRELHPIILSSFAKCLLATFILYLPCMLVTLKQIKSVSGYFSMPEVTLQVFVKCCRYPFTVGFTPFSIVLLLLSLSLFIRLIVRREKSTGDMYAIYCFILFYEVLIFGTVVSRLMTANIFTDRYLFFSLGLIWLFFAIEAGSLTALKKVPVYCIIMFELIIGIYSYTQAFTSEYAPGTDEMIAWLNENVSEGDSLYTLEDYEELAICLPFYKNGLTDYETLDEAVRAAGRGNVWVALMNGYEEETPAELPPGNPGYNEYAEEIEADGYSLEYIGAFRFDRYLYKMYKLAK